ncbi:hypothetical protein [Paenibacillus rhizovicinus]|uniref:hypothetical protein n=1 Tax=Paenibacillus rhizovicinus TaxID=2704463 RepID=UPI001CDD393C|nr:hypothetical protein [Paenibacillus rhizovicinus]
MMGTDQEIRIANEFASVTVRKVRTRNGERLEIVSNGLGLSICLDPLALESLTWQSADMFSVLLQTPLEPYRFGVEAGTIEGGEESEQSEISEQIEMNEKSEKIEKEDEAC